MKLTVKSESRYTEGQNPSELLFRVFNPDFFVHKLNTCTYFCLYRDQIMP